MTLLFNGDSKNQWGGTEYGGTFDGSPPLSTALQEGASLGGYSPPNGCTVMQASSVRPSDGEYRPGQGNWRTMSRQAEPIPLRSNGYDSSFVYAVLLPPGYPGDASMYVCPFEVHQTDPGGGTGVAPFHHIHKASDVTIDSYYGSSAAGGLGNPGRLTNSGVVGSSAAQYSVKGVWHIWVLRYAHSNSGNGAIIMQHALPGDSGLTTLINQTSISTMFGTTQNYILFGLYRNAVGSSTTIIYTAGWREYSTIAEAQSRAAVLMGGAAPPPPPPPSPPPSGGVGPLFHRPKLLVATRETLPTIDSGIQ